MKHPNTHHLLILCVCVCVCVSVCGGVLGFRKWRWGFGGFPTKENAENLLDIMSVYMQNQRNLMIQKTLFWAHFAHF